MNKHSSRHDRTGRSIQPEKFARMILSTMNTPAWRALTGEPALAVELVEAYAELDPTIIRALGGDRFPPMPLGLVR